MRKAMKEAGIDPIAPGDVRIIVNTDVVWTEIPKDADGTHRGIVVGSTALLQDPGFPVAWIVPCTTTPFYAGGECAVDGVEIAIPDGENGFTRKNVFAVAYLGQPIHKEDLGRRVGTVSAQTLLAVQGGIIQVLGLLEGEEEEEDAS
jgi:mRNA-degrading endonuclease toxin of MazEF toxin-antitoxin module